MFKIWFLKIVGWVIFPIGIYVWWQSRDLKRQLKLERETYKQAYRESVRREEIQHQLERSKQQQIKSLQKENKARVNLSNRKQVLKQIQHRFLGRSRR